MVMVKRKTAAAIQAAIDESAQGDTADNRTVFLPAGEYRLKSKPVYVRNGVTIMGEVKM
jgi:polygalacturonase